MMMMKNSVSQYGRTRKMENCKNCGANEFHDLDGTLQCVYCKTKYAPEQKENTYMSDEDYLRCLERHINRNNEYISSINNGLATVEPIEDKNKVPVWVWLIFIILPLIAPILFFL